MSTLETSTQVTSRIFKVPILKYEWVDTLDKPIRGERSSHFLIEAKTRTGSLLQAIRHPAYIENWKKASPEERKKFQPFAINEERDVEIMPTCDRMHKNSQGDYTCGKPTYDPEGHYNQEEGWETMNGEFGMCAINYNFDPTSPEEYLCPFQVEDREQTQSEIIDFAAAKLKADLGINSPVKGR